MAPLLLLSLLSQMPEIMLGSAPGSPAWVQRRLMHVDWRTPSGIVVRHEERVLRPQDAIFPEAFSLVPAAQALATTAHEGLERGSRWLTASAVAVGVGTALSLTPLVLGVSSTAPAVSFGLLGGGLVTLLTGLVFTLVAMPHLQRAQTDFFSAIATYNRGLLEVAPPVHVTP